MEIEETPVTEAIQPSEPIEDVSSTTSSSDDPGTLKVNFSDMKTLIAIDLPCYVKDYKKGIEICGGESNIKNTFQSKSSFIQIKLNSNADPLRHHLNGCREKSATLLLKLTRSSVQPSSSVSSSSSSSSLPEKKLIKAEILGRTYESYCFNQSADYQFLSSKATPLPTDNIIDYSTGLMVPINSNETVIEAIPRPFTKASLINVVMPIFQERKPPIIRYKHTNRGLNNPIISSSKNGEEGHDESTANNGLKGALSEFASLKFRKWGENVPEMLSHSQTGANVDGKNKGINTSRTRKRNLPRKRLTLSLLTRLFAKYPG